MTTRAGDMERHRPDIMAAAPAAVSRPRTAQARSSWGLGGDSFGPAPAAPGPGISADSTRLLARVPATTRSATGLGQPTSSVPHLSADATCASAARSRQRPETSHSLRRRFRLQQSQRMSQLRDALNAVERMLPSAGCADQGGRRAVPASADVGASLEEVLDARAVQRSKQAPACSGPDVRQEPWLRALHPMSHRRCSSLDSAASCDLVVAGSSAAPSVQRELIDS